MEHRFKAKVCLLLINLAMDIQVDELSYMKYLKSDMADRGVKVLLVLTGSMNKNGQEWTNVESRISALQS